MKQSNASNTPLTGAPILQARGLCKFYGEREVLHEVGFAIRAREIVTIVGPNGAGKTTLLNCLLGLDRADYGEVIRDAQTRIGYVPQHFKPQQSLPITVESFLKLYAPKNMAVAPSPLAGEGRDEGALNDSAHPLTQPSPARGEGLAVLAEKLAVTHLLGLQLANLSGGELRRVLLLRALLMKPNLLVLDEPTAGVDVSGQGELYRLLKKLSEELGLAVLMVSHDLHVVMASTDRVICLNHHVCCEGTPQHVGGNAEFRAMFGDQLADQIALYHHHHTHSHGLGDEEYPHTHHHAPGHEHHHHHDDDDEDGATYHHHACCSNVR